ncbi:MAG TPA: RnfABCDGE type electron transport complex subunit G [Candidatus Blautia intestinavium]|nr:RnfABCDGE type electron transport complex subunit G [Candidatus Blautia intestinavium]
MNSIVKDTLSITVITLVAGLALGIVQDITAGPIAQQQEKAKQEAYQAVFEDADSFETFLPDETKQAVDLVTYLDENGYDAQTVDEIMTAKDASGGTLGYAFTITSSEGYGGDIQFAMGVQNDGTLNGISILSIEETAGLGMKADTDEFKDQFKDKKVEKFTYTKNGAAADDEIDAISGATITTNAMTNGINAGLCAFRYVEGGAQ